MQNNHDFKVLWSNTSVDDYTEIFTYNGHKFQIHINRMSTSIGTAILYIMQGGVFHQVIDNKQIGLIDKVNCHLYTNKFVSANNSCIVDVFKDFVTAVYSD